MGQNNGFLYSTELAIDSLARLHITLICCLEEPAEVFFTREKVLRSKHRHMHERTQC